MNKYEIETAIIEELKNFMPSIKNVPFDKHGDWRINMTQMVRM